MILSPIQHALDITLPDVNFTSLKPDAIDDLISDMGTNWGTSSDIFDKCYVDGIQIIFTGGITATGSDSGYIYINAYILESDREKVSSNISVNVNYIYAYKDWYNHWTPEINESHTFTFSENNYASTHVIHVGFMNEFGLVIKTATYNSIEYSIYSMGGSIQIPYGSNTRTLRQQITYDSYNQVNTLILGRGDSKLLDFDNLEADPGECTPDSLAETIMTGVGTGFALLFKSLMSGILRKNLKKAMDEADNTEDYTMLTYCTNIASVLTSYISLGTLPLVPYADTTSLIGIALGISKIDTPDVIASCITEMQDSFGSEKHDEDFAKGIADLIAKSTITGIIAGTRVTTPTVEAFSTNEGNIEIQREKIMTLAIKAASKILEIEAQAANTLQNTVSTAVEKIKEKEYQAASYIKNKASKSKKLKSIADNINIDTTASNLIWDKMGGISISFDNSNDIYAAFIAAGFKLCLLLPNKFQCGNNTTTTGPIIPIAP